VEPFLKPGDLQRIARPVDWFGLNHYSPIYAIAKQDEPLGFQLSDAPVGAPRSPIGWEVDPGGFRDTLLDVHRRYRRPVYVMENGAGAEEALDAKGQLEDRHRVDYYAAYTAAMQEAVGQGADVRGYFAWSLLDNFEWNSGYKHRFGFYFVDYATQRRVPKASAVWYRGFIANHARRRPS
jgi:beta-glucosidase